MDYLLKASAIVVIFYVCYKLLLQRETFFASNRWFLLLGLVVASIIPTIVIPIYIEYSPQTFEGIIMTDSIVEQTIENSFDWFQLILWTYYAGVIFFFGRLVVQFFSLLQLVSSHEKYTSGKYIFVETHKDIPPFSFFNWIVYNPYQFSDEELTLIIKHEQVHANQFHSIDMLLSHIATTLFWFNPFVWLYKKELQQNLEFIADQTAQNQSDCEKSYQKLLLKASIPHHQLMLTNNFYNSLIKKRIVMLHKSKSKKFNAWKYALILPAIALFMMSFNTKEVLVKKNLSENNPSTEHLNFKSNSSLHKDLVITKDFTDADIDNLKNELKSKGFESKFKGIKRNDKGEITSIKIEISSDETNTNFQISTDNPIKPISIIIDEENNNVSINTIGLNNVKGYVFTTEDGNHKIQSSGNGSNVFVFSSDDNDEGEIIEEKIIIMKDGKEEKKHKIKKLHFTSDDDKETIIELDDNDKKELIFIATDKNGKQIKDTIWLKKEKNKVNWTSDKDEDVEVIFVEKKDKKVHVFTGKDESPLILLNGKEITKEEMDAINPDTIESVNVLKGTQAIEKHGKKAKDGVIIITTKKKN